MKPTWSKVYGPPWDYRKKEIRENVIIRFIPPDNYFAEILKTIHEIVESRVAGCRKG